MKPAVVNIMELINRWMTTAMTGQLILTIDFNQGGIRNVGVNEKTVLSIK